MDLEKYLRETKEFLVHFKKSSSGVIHVVLGNESCDLDSVVCAITQGYYLRQKTNDVTVPVLNVPHEKYHLRTETIFLLTKSGITEDLLTFSDQIDLKDLHHQARLKISLVDLNVLPEEYSSLEECVITVTDHRPQVRKPDSRVKINIALVGSCSTLIAEEILKDPDFSPDKTVLTLLYGTILMDTVNLSPAAEKKTVRDVAVVDQLRDMLPEVDGDDLYNKIKTAKTDISGLSTRDLLEKDLKKVIGAKVKVAMPSLGISLEDLLTRGGLEQDLKEFQESEAVDAIVILMIHEITAGHPKRELAVYSTTQSLLNQICRSLTSETDPDLELKQQESPIKDSLIIYHQGCVKASRKLVLPIIQKAVHVYEGNQANFPLDSSNVSGDQSQAASSLTSDNFDLLNLNNQSDIDKNENSGQSTSEANTFSGMNITDLDFLDASSNLNATNQNQPLNFDLLDSGHTTNLLGDFDPLSAQQVLHHTDIPEISINSNQEEFDEADVMFNALNSRNSLNSSAHTSEPGSAFTSVPVTPPNSFIDVSGQLHAKDFTLPSLNSAEMLEKIREKKSRLRSSESAGADDNNEGGSVPYTPRNSYMDGAFEQYAKDHHLPSFNSMEMVQRIKQKRSSMETSQFDDEDQRVRTDSGIITPFTPHNSYCDVSMLDSSARSNLTLDTNQLQRSLSKELSNKSKVIEESGLVVLDVSDMFDPLTVDNNVVAVGLAQEMLQREATDDNVLIFDDTFSGDGNGKTESKDEDKSSGDKFSESSPRSDEKRKNSFHSRGGNSDHSAFHQSIEEFADNFTGKLIDEAITTFPETNHEIISSGHSYTREEVHSTESIVKSPVETDYLLSDEVPVETDYLSSDEVPVETDYLSSVDPFHGNLNLVEDNDEVVESSSFRKISGGQPQTVKEEILNSKESESSDELVTFATNLVQQVISSVIETIPKATSVDHMSDISGESGVTWSREESFDTVSSIPNFNWSHRGSLDIGSLDRITDSGSSQNSLLDNLDSVDCLSDSSAESVTKTSDVENMGEKSGKTYTADNNKHAEESNQKRNSVGYISETENLSPTKIENTSLQDQLEQLDKESVPCIVDGEHVCKESIDCVSSQSSEPTSTTTEGSYQVLSPDQQLNDIKGEITQFQVPTSNVFNIGTNGEINESNLTVEREDNKENLSKTQTDLRSEHNEIDNSEGDVSKRKEIYHTSAGRISITSDGSDLSSVNKCESFTAKSGVGVLLTEADETITQADELIIEADTLLTNISSQDVDDKKDLISETSEDRPDNNVPEGATANYRQDVKPVANTEPIGVKKGMDLTEEWHEDPIPGMEENDYISSENSSGSDSEDNSDRPANRPNSLQTSKKKKISANFNILKEDYTSTDDIDTTDNAGDLEWENDTPISISKESLPEYSAEDEYQDAKHWRGIEVNGKQQKIDLKVIEPFKKVLTHGGYYGDGLNALIVFSGCCLPDRSRKDYHYVMDNLFLYVISTLELLVAEDYMIVYFHGATPSRQMPSFGWLKKCYQMIDRRLKKNLKGLLLVHPTLWLRTIVLMTKPFISSKFSSKLRFVRTLQELSQIVPMEYIFVPEQVQKYDSNLLQPPHPSPSTAPPL